MAVYRAEKKKGFTIISNVFLHDKRLSASSRGVMAYILSLPDYWDYSIRGLSTASGIGVCTIRSALNELERYGYIDRHQEKDEGGRFSKNVYDIYEIPPASFNDTAPTKSQSHPASPSLGKPSSMSCTQQNTNVTQNVINQKESKKQASHPEKPRKSFNELIDEFTSDELLRTALRAWLQTRYRQRKPLTNTSLQMALARLTRAASGAIDAMIEIVETAVVNGWCDFRARPSYVNNGNTPTQSGKRVSAQNYAQRQYTDEELNALLVDISSLDDV